MRNKNNSLKILFITDNFPPEVNAPATRTYEHCREWVKRGLDVTVITGFPNFPIGRVFDGFKNKLFQREEMDGIKVIRVWTYITENKGIFKRTLDYFSFAVSSFIAGLFVKADIIVATSPQFFTTWSAFILSLIKKVPWVFEVRDLWPHSILAVGAITNKFIIKILEGIELFLYRKSSKIVVVSESFKTNIENRGIPGDKIVVIPNGVYEDLFKNLKPDLELKKSLGIEVDKFVVSYIGTHGLAHGLDFILAAVSEIKNPNIHFLFIGEGAEKKKLVQLARKLKLNNVTFLDQVKKSEVVKYLSITDVVLVPLKKHDVFKTVIPSKIFEAAAAGKPILLGVNGEARKLIEKYNAGIFFEPENKKDFLNKLNILIQAEDLTPFIKGCQNLIKDFDRKVLAKKYIKIFEELVKNEWLNRQK